MLVELDAFGVAASAEVALEAETAAVAAAEHRTERQVAEREHMAAAL